MTTIVVNETLRVMLHDFSQPLALRNDEGQLLGHFVPAAAPLVGTREPPPLTEEELQRREAEESDYSTAEVVAYLESLQ